VKRTFTVVLGSLIFMLASHAQAYGDPGSGALLWQMGGAILVGAMFYVRRFVLWVGTRVRRKPEGEVREDG
jgi:hypothetical protein